MRAQNDVPEGNPQIGIGRRELIVKAAGGVASMSVLATFAAACGNGSSAGTVATAVGKPPAAPTGVLRIALGTPPITLDPALASTEGDLMILAQICDGLLMWDAGFETLRPGLAESWQASDDAREFTFKLRSGATFHDGTPVDATAIRKTFEYYVSSKNTLAALLVGALDKIDDSDPTTLRITTKAAAPDFLRYQTFLRMIAPSAIAKGSAGINKHPMGSGAFRFVSNGPNGVVLEAFDGYWGPGPYFQRIEIPIIKDPTQQIDALRTGQVGLVQRVPPPQVRQLQNDTRSAKLVSTDSWSVAYMKLQVNKKPFDDLRVRQAFAHAIDTDTIVKDVLLGQGYATASLLPKGSYGYADMPRAYPYDPGKARALLQQAGATGASVTLAANTASVASYRMTQAVAAQLGDAGFNARAILIPDLGTFLTDLGAPVSKYEAYNANNIYVSGSPIIPLLGVLGGNTKYKGKDLADILQRLGSTPDGPARLAIARELETLNAEKVLFVPIARIKATDALDPKLQGYVEPRDTISAYLAPTYRSA